MSSDSFSDAAQKLPADAADAVEIPDTSKKIVKSEKKISSTDSSYILCQPDQLKNYPPAELSKIYLEAANKFNMKPSSARDFLAAKNVIQGLPSEMAEFIFVQTKLSKRRIGEYIGKPDAYNQHVCEALMYKYDFAAIPIDDAIRVVMRQVFKFASFHNFHN